MPDINVNKLSEILNTKADIDLNNTGVFSTSSGGVNLTSSTPVNANGKEVTSADFIKSDIQSNLLNYTTNRILEIPQDIKLELNNGTLTLKAGSKTYKADGIVVTVPSDINYYFTGTTVDNLILVYDSPINGMGVYIQGANAISSATAPSTGVADTLWFDTTSNKCKITHDNAATWTEIPLPIGLVSCNTTDGFTSIVQVFNGFGYIGSTIFALPGVKCQFADGRNEDGSYKTYIKTTDKILTKTFGAETFNGFDCSLVCRNDTIDGFAWHVNEDFDNKSGYIMINKTEGIDKNLCPVFRFFINSSSDNGKISQFIPNPIDKLNWKSTELSGMSMPSNKYIVLTLGASGTTYTAPANGWFYLQMTYAADKYVDIWNSTSNTGCIMSSASSGAALRALAPCRKGDIIVVNYSATTKEVFKFVYAEGEN